MTNEIQMFPLFPCDGCDCHVQSLQDGYCIECAEENEKKDVDAE